MSLRVNLIMPEEQRSGSKLNMKSLLRIGSVVFPALVILLIAQQALRSFMLNSQLSVLESQWSAIEPKQRQAARLTSRLNSNLTTKTELDAWVNAKPVWHRFFMAMMESVPASIQLTTLRISLLEDPTSKVPAAPSPPIRTFVISVDGTTRDEYSMRVVQELEKRMREHPEIQPLVDSIKVANFAADLESEDAASRIFTIECRFSALPLKEKR